MKEQAVLISNVSVVLRGCESLTYPGWDASLCRLTPCISWYLIAAGWSITLLIQYLDKEHNTQHQVTTEGLEPAIFGLLAKHLVLLSFVLHIKTCHILVYQPFFAQNLGRNLQSFYPSISDILYWHFMLTKCHILGVLTMGKYQ